MINQDTNNDLLSGAFKMLIEAVKKVSESSLPCRVLSVSEDRTRVSVSPLIKIVGRDSSQVSRADIEGLPVLNSGAGDFFMSFPIKEGDLGWIQASDRDISLFLQGYENSEPATARKHSFSDARFIPDIMKNFTISAEDNNSTVISNRLGTVKIALDDSEIRITAPSIKMNEAEITAAGDVVSSTGISLSTHTHPYVDTPVGASTTGAPTP